MRISDWSSDVCSSDLTGRVAEYAHGLAVVVIGQAVPGHVVEHFGAAVLDAGARAVEQVRRIGHRLHAAGDHDIGRAGLDQVVAEHDRLHAGAAHLVDGGGARSEEHTSELQSLMRISYAVFCLQKKTHTSEGR